VPFEDRVEVYRALRRLRRGARRRDVELEIERVEHAQEVAELGVRFPRLELIHPFSAHARSLRELVLTQVQLQPTGADLRGCLADGSHAHVLSSRC
jgi:hypothetical protein